MRQQFAIQGRSNQFCGISIVAARRRLEVHSAAPRRGSFGMNPRENRPRVSECPFDDCGSSVGILAYHQSPASKLGTVLPVLIEGLSCGYGNRYRCLADTLRLGGVEPEPRARCQIQTVVRRVAGEKSPCADAEIIQTIADRLAQIGSRGSGQVVADLYEISARKDQ